MAPTQVVLVGRRIAHNENLGLAYLRTALDQAGYSHVTHYLNAACELGPIADDIMRRKPAVVGLSFLDGNSAFLPLALGELLARRGYRGHVTSGGQFATLAREWLLARYAWLDSVVRFFGELPLAELVGRVVVGLPADGVPGVTTRAGDGAPAPVLSQAPMRIRPTRDELPEILGYPAAHILASRGCAARCHYCGPAAYATLERKEGKAGGASLVQLRGAGVGGIRRRDLSELCDEMAELWHERGVRYFYFVDEHLLPHREADALDFLAQWRAGLAERRVGRLGIGLMLRAGWITPRVVHALADVGVVRCFVGYELASAEEGRGFGRKNPRAQELALLPEFHRRGVATVSNLMLLHPDSTLESIAGGVRFLEAIEHGVFEATRMLVYHGTKLHERMQQAGRLSGNPLRYDYTFGDERVEAFSEIFTRLRNEAFADYSIAYRAHDTELALSLARRLSPGRMPARLAERCNRSRSAVNALYVRAYDEALALAGRGLGYRYADPLIERMAEHASAHARELDAVYEALLDALERPARSFQPMNAAASTTLSFVLLGASALGCTDAFAPEPERGGSTQPAPTTPMTQLPKPPPNPGSPAPGGSPAPANGAGGSTFTPPGCITDEETVRELVLEADACFSGAVSQNGSTVVVRELLSAYTTGIFSFEECSSELESPRERALADRLQAEGSICLPTPIRFAGEALSDLRELAAAANEACSSARNLSDYVVVVDADGKVRQVENRFGQDAGVDDVAACLLAALEDLVFPCLAALEICPVHVIIE